MNLKRILTVLFYVIIIASLIYYGRQMNFDVIWREDISLAVLLIAILISFSHKFLHAIGWRILLGDMTLQPVDYRNLYQAHSLSCAGRYLPGKVAMAGARVLYARELGISPAAAILSFFLDVGLQFATVLALGSFLFFVSGETFPEFPAARYFFLLITLMFPLVFLYPYLTALFKKYVVDRMDSRESWIHYLPDFRLRLRTLFYFVGLHLVVNFFYGLTGFFIIESIVANTISFFAAWVVFALSLVSGMLLIIAPAGLGAREAVMVALLSLYVPLEIALLISVVQRILDFGTDMAYFAFTSIVVSLLRNRKATAK